MQMAQVAIDDGFAKKISSISEGQSNDIAIFSKSLLLNYFRNS